MGQMSAAEKKILEEVEYLNDRYFVFDEPVPFCGFFLYPVGLRHYNEFMTSNSCLLLNKNDDPAGVRLSNLDYLLSKIGDQKEGVLWSMRLSKIIELCCHVRPGMKCSKCGKYIPYDQFFTEERIAVYQNGTDEECRSFFNCDCGDGQFVASLDQKKDEKTGKSILVIDGHEVDINNFNKFRKFILYQNLPDYEDDSYVDKEIRDDFALKAEMQARHSGRASLEQKIICVCAKSPYKIEEIYDMSIRKFTMLISTINDAMEYQITRTGLMSGMVSLKDGKEIDHWIYKKKKSLYDSAVDAQDFTSKINGG